MAYPVLVKLTKSQMDQGRESGEIRTKSGKSFKNKHGLIDNGQAARDDINGARGELAARIAISADPIILNHNFGDPDIPPDGHVRTSAKYPNLLVRPSEVEKRPNDYFIGVHSDGYDNPLFAIQGFALGSWIKDNCKEFLRSPNGRPPAWFIPPRILLPMQYWPVRDVLHQQFRFEEFKPWPVKEVS